MKNLFKMAPDWFLVFMAGISNGIMDSIAWHNSYANYGWLWDLNSWKNLYTNQNWFQNLFGASLNVWHFSKLVMLTCFFILIFRNALFPYKFIKNIYWIIYFLFLIIFFIIGFQMAYK